MSYVAVYHVATPDTPNKVLTHTDDIAATLIYGFFKDFNISLAFSNTSYCQIEIEGLT